MDQEKQETGKTEFKLSDENKDIEDDSPLRLLKQLAPVGGAFLGAYLGNKQATTVLGINSTVTVNNSQYEGPVPKKPPNNKEQSMTDNSCSTKK